ncbi:hypothetical protein LTR08_000030 [Meristemomyces frigidus]|nr:hypothetical protein LTR08_000030 [Meristemomyces frigidus]
MAGKNRKKKMVDATRPLHMRYKQCIKADLATFTRNRGLQVANTSRRHEPTRMDHVRALEQADIERTFRFLELAPELRNIIYKELLVLHNCCILYGDNLYEIRGFRGKVRAHGFRCGPYAPVDDLHDFRTLVWPDFLRRVHHLRLAIINLPRNRARTASVGNILVSLCTFLASGKHLVSLHLDLEWLPSHGLVHGMKAAFYPLRLLGPSPQITVSGFDESVTTILLAQLTRLTGNSTPSTWSTIDDLNSCAETCAALTALVRPRLSRADREPPYLLHLFGKALFTLLLRRSHRPTLIDGFMDYVDHLRVCYERVDFRALTYPLRAKVEDILRKGVDLRRRQLRPGGHGH